MPSRPPSHWLLLAARVGGAALIAGMGAIHLHLWDTGYRHIATIGVLFILNAIGAGVLAVTLLVVPLRLLAAAAAGGVAMAAGTLVGLLLSVTNGLFGFTESSQAPDFTLSIVVEVAATVVLAVVALYTRPQLNLHRSTVA